MTTDTIPRSDIEDDDAIEAQLGQARLDAFMAAPTWETPEGETYDLQPATEWRFELAYQLNEADGGIDWQGVQENVFLFLPFAAKLLWLLSHDEAEITAARRDRAKWLMAIDTWSSTHIPRHDAEKVTRAIALGSKLLEQRRINRAVPRPSDAGGKEGNSPRH